MLEIAVLNPNPPEHQSQNPPNLDHLVITMGLDIFGTLENTKLETQSSFQPLERWFLTEGNEKEGLADGRGFGGKKHHQVWCKAHFRCMFLKLPETILGCH